MLSDDAEIYYYCFDGMNMTHTETLQTIVYEFMCERYNKHSHLWKSDYQITLAVI